MARASRRSFGRGRARRPRADWVYRYHDVSYNAMGVPIPENGLGTYQATIIAHGVGPDNAQGHILYDSANFHANWVFAGTPNAAALAPVYQLAPARPEGMSKPLILAVEGVIFWQGTDWALGSELSLGTRIGVFEQSPDNGLLSLDAAYTMWGGTAPPQFQPVIWANNGRNNAWERRPYLRYIPGQERNYIIQKVMWRGRRRLEANECFALYTELELGSNPCTGQYWLRTLVADDQGG